MSSPDKGSAASAVSSNAKATATASTTQSSAVRDASLVSKKKVVTSSLHVATAAEPTSNGEAVSFTVSGTDGFDPVRTVSGEEKVDILDAVDAGPEVDSEVTVQNASAWFSIGASSNRGSEKVAPKVPVTDFERYKRLNEEKKVRERVDAEEAIRLRQVQLAEETRKKNELEARQSALDRERKMKKAEAELLAQKKKENEIAERLRLREQAKKEREALEGKVDIHEQNNAMMDFANGDEDDGGLDDMLDE